MDASGLSRQEAAALEQIMQKKQVGVINTASEASIHHLDARPDERLHDTLLWPRREMLHGLCKRLHNYKAQSWRGIMCEPLR